MKTTKLTTRLSSIAVLIVAALLLELTTAMQYFSARTGITRKMVEMAHRDLSESDRTVELKRDVELTVAQMLPTIERLTAQLATDSLRLYINEILDSQDEIVGFENYPYKNKMMVKEECKNFVKLSYLFDYIMLDLLRRMFIFSITDVLNKLDEYNAQPIPPKKENILNKNGEYIKPQMLNPNRVVPYFMIQCKLDDNQFKMLIEY